MEPTHSRQRLLQRPKLSDGGTERLANPAVLDEPTAPAAVRCSAWLGQRFMGQGKNLSFWPRGAA
ncbi:hypothetical protein QQ054_32585 [Oscillatoria amoena NRMC-F 0135]|nr:hypothetical protein [Oscillatoria amoena NRMC-F 0135]